MAFYVNYTIIKNNEGIPSGRYRKKFLTKFGAQKYITELLYSKKRRWYKYVRNVRA